jgi:hypothetical protein
MTPPSGPVSLGVWRDLNGRSDEEHIAALAPGCASLYYFSLGLEAYGLAGSST